MLTMTVSYFNPRSREGSDGEVSLAIAISGISIHAPAKGATSMPLRRLPFRTGFQSTLPRRERRFVAKPATQRIQISIHAPAKGATQLAELLDGIEVFQSTLPRRERRSNYARFKSESDFNPRSREGSDSCRLRARFPCVHFNPRSREGSDSIY